jgi:hypothetical protein
MSSLRPINLRAQHLPCFVTVRLPRKRSANTDQNSNGKTGKDAEHSSDNRWPAAREMIVLETARPSLHGCRPLRYKRGAITVLIVYRCASHVRPHSILPGQPSRKRDVRMLCV